MAFKVTLCDYGVGNLLSVRRALEAVDADVEQTGDPTAIKAAERLVLPGVGAFGACLGTLAAHDLTEPVRDFSQSGRPFLGICVGMQMLLDCSDEFGAHAGLGLLPGSVRRIPSTGANSRSHKIPHIGWTEIVPAPAGPGWDDMLLADIAPGTSFYFVHSYTAWPSHETDRIADAEYGGQRIAAVIGRAPMFGCQFHPEKSGPAGLAILRRFLTL